MISKVKKIMKNILGVDNITLYIHKKCRIFYKLIYRQKYDASDIVNEMEKMGMKKGSTVFIHCSMTQFYNYNGSVETLIESILNIIGNEGTLLMPAFPAKLDKIFEKARNNSDEILFDVKHTPTGAGYIAEIFRKMPGVKRSINLQHSVCAIGKDADYFLSEHHLSKTAWDKFSPYYKICTREVMIFKFGLPNFIGTSLHCTESLLCDKYKYFSLFFQGEITYKYADSDNNICTHTMRCCTINRRANNKRIRRKYLEPRNIIHKSKLSNLLIEMNYASDILREFINLADNGITIFDKPDPKPFLKDGKFVEL